MMAARALRDNFIEYMHAQDRDREAPLAQYLDEWLEHGNAVVESGGDFVTYLQGVLFIIAEWAESPSFLNFEGTAEMPPHTIEVCGLVEDLSHFEHTYAFDRDWYNSVIFRRLLGRAGD